MEYDFDIVHRTGIKHQAADALPRLNIEATKDFNIGDDIPVFTGVTRAQSRHISSLTLLRIGLLMRKQNQMLQRSTSSLVHKAPTRIAKRFDVQ